MAQLYHQEVNSELQMDEFKSFKYTISVENLICHQEETLNNLKMTNFEENEHVMEEHFAIDGLAPCVYEYWRKIEEIEENELLIEEEFDVSPHESDTSIAHVEEEAKKEIELTFERPKEPQKDRKEDQPLALVNPPTLR
ncbi:hypothetical protein Scep_004545 [Stephania cephalantha]|uniref:Uncharacterized protein n=1 Tax=Stephania cephalantha TaxID=152367 RepID=A0AAP0KSN7_9MAGN